VNAVSRSLSLVAIVCGLLLAGCAPRASEYNEEAQRCAAGIVGDIFVSNNDDNFALEQQPDRPVQLVQFRGLRITVTPQDVSSEGKLKGISGRHQILIECAQSRVWNGAWTPWKEGTSGKAAFTEAMAGVSRIGYCSFRIQKEQERWVAVNMMPSHQFLTDKELLSSLVRQALPSS
jgi:hypothetical protein